MVGQNKATMRKKLRSALAHKQLADNIVETIQLTQQQWNQTLDKLNVDAPAVTPAVAALATLNLTADIALTSVATGAARNGNTLTLEVEVAAANPLDTVLVTFSGTAAAIICTVTPNDGTNNAATPVDLTTDELVELINTGAVVGKTITLTDGNSRRVLQTATGGDATVLVDSGEGDGIVGTFAGGANAIAGLDTNYVAVCAISSLFDFDAAGKAQHKATFRKSLRSALAHKKLADEIADSIEELQVAFNTLLAKLDAEAGTLNDTNYVSLLGLSAFSPDTAGDSAQHKATFRKSLRSALANRYLADQLIANIANMQQSFNRALAVIDTAVINGAMATFKVEVIAPDEV